MGRYRGVPKTDNHPGWTMNEKIKMGDLLTLMVSDLLGIATSYSGNGLMDIDGNDMDWDDYCIYLIEPNLRLRECSIDGILMFGDGTLEFRCAETADAHNWAEFSNEDLQKVIDYLKEL